MKFSTAQIMRSICRESFADFCKEFWHTVVPEKLIWNWHMGVICNELQAAAERVFKNQAKDYDLVINIAPGSSKSTIASILFPAWCWTRMPSFRFIGASYAHNLAMDLSRKNRDVVLSEEYQTCFPEIKLREDQSAKSYFVNTQGGARYTTGSLGMITGMHSHWIGIDDPINPKESLSEQVMYQVNNWIKETLSSRKVDRRITVTSLIMQRLHQEDPTAQALKKKRIRHVCIPAELTDDVHPPELRENYKNGLMDETRLPKEVLEEALEDMQAYAYAGQYLQNPVPISGGMFDTTRLNYGMPSNLVNVWRSWDKAGTANKSKKGRGAFTVGAKIGIDDGNRIWILDIIRVRYGSYDREKLICDTAEMDGNNVKVCVEQEPGSGGKESAEGTVSRLIGYHIVIDRPVGDKETRADPFSVQVNAGNVWLIPGEWNKDFVDEMKFFPFSTTKDQIDACSAGFSKLSVKKIRVGGMRSRYDSNVKINPHEINSKKKTEDAILNKIKKRIRSMTKRNG